MSADHPLSIAKEEWDKLHVELARAKADLAEVLYNHELAIELAIEQANEAKAALSQCRAEALSGIGWTEEEAKDRTTVQLVDYLADMVHDARVNKS